MDAVEEVRRRGGIARRSSLPRHGVARALAAGHLVSPRRGVVAVPDLGGSALTALRLGGVLSCCSAARWLGLQLVDVHPLLHVTVPRSLAVPPTPGVVLHGRDVPRLDVCTTLPRTAVDCARCCSRLDGLVVLDQTLARGIDRSELSALARGRGSSAARELLLLADGRAGASGETAARLVCVLARLRVQPQAYIPGVGYVDLLVEDRLIVEVDGLAYHSDCAQFSKDRRRDAASLRLGYRVVRFTWADAIHRPQYVIETILAVLEAL